MLRWKHIIGLSAALFALLAPGAPAASPYAKATLVSCDRDAREAVFEGRVTTVRRAAKMQMRFTLQVTTPDEPAWSRIAAEGFGQWITAPPAYGKYTYDKTVEDLLAPGNYRAVIDFRWRDRRGRTVRTEKATSPVCKQPDARPDLVVRSVRAEAGEYVAVVYNRGHEDAGPFEVEFLVDGEAAGTVDVIGLAPQTPTTVMTLAPLTPACPPGTPFEAVADPLSQIDESSEENNSLTGVC